MLRFSHLSNLVFENLDNQSLVHCKLISRSWSNYIEQQKFLTRPSQRSRVLVAGSQAIDEDGTNLKVFSLDIKSQLGKIIALGYPSLGVTLAWGY